MSVLEGALLLAMFSAKTLCLLEIKLNKLLLVGLANCCLLNPVQIFEFIKIDL